MKSRPYIAVAATLSLLSLACNSPTSTPTTRTVTLVDGIVSVAAGGWNTTQVNVTSDMQNPRVVGSFTASGGSGNDIVVLVMPVTEYTNWSSGHRVTPLYNSGQITTASYNVNLAVATYYVVYDNSFSTITSKAVTTHVNLVYEN